MAAISALLAAGLLLVFLSQYRESVNSATDLETVLVAKSLIEEGSPGSVVAEHTLFQTTTVKKDDLKDGAISDPSSLRGKVATTDIFPGEQLLASEFVGATPGIHNRLRGFDRAIAVPLDEAHGLIGNIKSGDRVDVLAGIGLQQGASDNRRATLRVIARDALVLKAPDKPAAGAAGASSQKPVVLRVSDRKASEIAFAADIGKVWLVARPKVGARESKSRPVTDLHSLILGSAARVLEQVDEPSDAVVPSPGLEEEPIP